MMDDFFAKAILSIIFLLFFMGTTSIILSIFFEKNIEYSPPVKKKNSSIDFDDVFKDIN